MRTGKRPAQITATTPRLGGALLGGYQPPPVCDWTKAVKEWPLLCNDTIGDCVPVAVLHLLQALRANAWGSTWQPADIEALSLYGEWGGYDGTPLTDHGTVMSVALNLWGAAGYTVGGAESVPWIAYINPRDELTIKTAIAELGGALGGIMLPMHADGTMFDDWTVLPDAADVASQDGHCIFLAGYDADGLIAITWGQAKRISWPFWRAFADECWAAGSGTDWLDARAGKSPSGLNWTQIAAEVARLAA